MSKIEFTFDSDSKALSVSIDGQTVDNVSGVGYDEWEYDEKKRVSLYLSISKKVDNLTVRQSLNWAWEYNSDMTECKLLKHETRTQEYSDAELKIINAGVQEKFNSENKPKFSNPLIQKLFG